MICGKVGWEDFQTTPASQKAMDDPVPSAEVKAALIDLKPDLSVTSSGGPLPIPSRANSFLRYHSSRV